MSANRPIRLIARDGSKVDRVQHRQPRFGSVCFGDSRRVSSSRAEGRRYADELFVEQHDCSPLGPAGLAAAGPLSMHRLNCGFELKPPGAIVLRRLGELAFRLFD